MNRFWKNRNRISRGATVSSVAAQVSDHRAPISLAWAKIARPTVSRRLAGLLMTISGHRKLFHW